MMRPGVQAIPPPGAAGDVCALRRCVRDLVALATLPALWTDLDASKIAGCTATALVGAMALKFAYLRLRNQPDAAPIEIIRLGEGADPERSAAIRVRIAEWLVAHPASRDGEISHPDQGAPIRFTSAAIGSGDDAMLIVASRRHDFPTEPERALIAVATSQTALAMQRCRADRSLHASEQLFRQFAENSTPVLWIANVENGTVEYLSPAFERVWGQAAETVLRDRGNWQKSLHPDDRARMAFAHARIMAGEAVALDYRIVRPDGAIRWIHDIAFPIRDEHGRLCRVGGIAQDLTKQDLALVYVIDSDNASRQATTLLLRGAGYEVRPFASETAFLEVAPALAAGCVLLDIRHSGLAGLTVPRDLKARRLALPVIVTGPLDGDVALAVQAMKAGAVDYLEMSYARDVLLAAVASALADARQTVERDSSVGLFRQRVAGLTARERQVLDALLAGGTNKTIAKQLGLSPRTVELHRARLMERLHASTLPEAVLIAAAAGVGSAAVPNGSSGSLGSAAVLLAG